MSGPNGVSGRFRVLAHMELHRRADVLVTRVIIGLVSAMYMLAQITLSEANGLPATTETLYRGVSFKRWVAPRALS